MISADYAGFRLLEVNVTEFHSLVGDEHAAHLWRDVLHVGASEPAGAVGAPVVPYPVPAMLKVVRTSSVGLKPSLRKPSFFRTRLGLAAMMRDDRWAQAW